MTECLEDRLTRQFYDWELWGRGWQAWPEPVDLEPPFHPFFGHFVGHGIVAPVDDGRRPTILSSIADGFLSLFRRSDPSPEPAWENSEHAERVPYLFLEEHGLAELQIALPPETKVTKDASEQFLLNLGHASRPVSFELVGTSESIVVQVACGERDRRHVREQLQAYFPDCLASARSGYLANLWNETATEGTAVVEFGLSNEFMRPLRCFERFEPDPLAGVIGAMAGLGDGEIAVFQILFAPVKNPWPESILRAVTDGEGGSFFVDDPGMVKLSGQKISSPLFAAVVRVAAQGPTERKAWRIVQGLARSLRQFADPKSNEFIPLSNDEYDDPDHAADLVMRRSRRCGILLNSDELVSLVHLPSASVRAEKLKREDKRTKAAPALALGHRLVLGQNSVGGKTAVVSLSPEMRVRHTHIIGTSGTGKSTLLFNLIVQDIRNGEGLAVLDPHGDLIDRVLEHVPEERYADVVLLDPSDAEYPVGFNILSAHSELERNLLASDLVAVFRRLSTSWGDQMTAILGNAILAFLESSTGGTLSDLRRFLVEGSYRQHHLETVQDPEIVYYWLKEFPLLTGKPQAPILTRLDTFLRPKIIRHMVAQKEKSLDFGTIMNGRKILLAKLAQGLIGEENSYLLGTLIVSKLNQIAMSRQEMQAAERKHFYLYIDEFHNFVTPSMAAILSGARKYHLGLVLAHQELNQLQSRDSEVASAVISNPYTRICFRLGDFDARKLEDGFSFFKARDLQNLGVGEAVCRIERSEYDFNLTVVPLPGVEPTTAAHRRGQIIASSRERHAVRREEVERLLASGRDAPPSDAVRESVQKRTPPVRAKESPPHPPPADSPVPSVEQQPPLQTPSLAEPPSLGRGGHQHKYLQQLIKRWAETNGYRATIEKQILDGLGSVDVALEKGERSIACEISVSTTPEHELGNIQKCLAAGFGDVVVLATEKKSLKKIAAAAKDLGQAEIQRVRFLLPEELFSYLEAQGPPSAKEQTVRGYKVKVKLNPVTAEQQQAKKQAIAQTVLQSMRRLKDKEQS